MILVYIIFFLFWFIYNYKHYGFNASTFLIFMYLLIGLASIALLYIYKTFDDSLITIRSICSLILFLFLFLYPIVKMGNNKFSINISSKLMKIFAWYIIIFSLIVIVDSASEAVKSFSYGDLHYARSLYTDSMDELQNRTNNILLNFLLRAGTQYSFFAMFFAFYFKIMKKNNFLFYLLLISSATIVIYNLTIAGRDGIVRWVFMFIFSYLTYKGLINNKDKRRILLYGVFAAIPLLMVFLSITDARFGDSYETYTFGQLYYIINYLGQSPIYFCTRFEPMFDGSMFSGYINVPTNIFSTFVGSMYYNYGFYLTLLFSILFFLVFLYISKRKNNYSKFPLLIVYIYLYQVQILGVFYDMFRGISSRRYFLILLIFSIIISIIDRKTQVKQLNHKFK